MKETRYRNSDIDILTLQKMFNKNVQYQFRKPFNHSRQSLVFNNKSSSKPSSKKSINSTVSFQTFTERQQLKHQRSAKNINIGLLSLSQKLDRAKLSINEENFDKSRVFVNLNHKNSELNINIKDHGVVKLHFYPQEKEQQDKYIQKLQRNFKKQKKQKIIHNINKRQQLKLKMGKSKIQDFTNIEQKPRNLVKLPPTSYKNRKKYFISQLIRAKDESNSLAIEHLNMTLQIMKQKSSIIHQLQNNAQQSIFLPYLQHLKGKKTLILDLDETLIHCFQNSQVQPDIKLDLIIENNDVHIQILLRPYVITFLKKISQKWQVVIFTASYQQYADGILNEIDPQNKIFHHRLYRQHCTYINDIYIKDLSRLNRDLRKTVIVDNSAYSYLLQLQNSIPIFSYYDGNDSQLSSLQSYLAILQKSQDVREINKNYFKLDQYENYQKVQELIKQLYMQ